MYYSISAMLVPYERFRDQTKWESLLVSYLREDSEAVIPNRKTLKRKEYLRALKQFIRDGRLSMEARPLFLIEIVSIVQLAVLSNTYKAVLDKVINKCPGCKTLHLLHLPTFGCFDLAHQNETDEYELKWKSFFDCYPLAASGIEAAKRILLVVCAHLNVEYCPILPDMICILLLFLDEIHSFAVLCEMISYSRSIKRWTKRVVAINDVDVERFHYFPVDYKSSILFSKTFVDVLQIRESELYKKLIDNQSKRAEMELLMTRLFERFFITVLPLHYVIRIFDCFLMEGAKVLYRIALIILVLVQEDIQVINDIPKAIVDFFKSPATKSFKRKTAKLKKLNYVLYRTCRRTSAIDTSKLSFQLLSAFAFGIKNFKSAELLKIDVKNASSISVVSNTLDNIKPHFLNHTFKGSSTVNTIDEATRLIHWLPVKSRARADTLRLQYSTEVHGRNLKSLYQQCSKADVGACLILVRAMQTPKSSEENHTTSDRMIFGAYCSEPLVTSHDVRGDDTCFLFRLSPAIDADVWRYIPASKVAGTSERSGESSVLPDTRQREQIRQSDQVRMKFVSAHYHSLMFGAISHLNVDSEGNFIIDDDADDVSNSGYESGDSCEEDGSDNDESILKQDEYRKTHSFGPGLWLCEDLLRGHTGWCTTYKNDPLCLHCEHDTFETNSKEIKAHMKHHYFSIEALEVYTIPKIHVQLK